MERRDEQPGPTIILDDAGKPAERLDFGWEKAVAAVAPPTSRGWSTLGLLASGAATLALGLALLEAANFVAGQFARAGWLGWLTLAVVAAGFGLIFGGIAREIRGYLALRSVDRAHAARARGDAATLRAELDSWQSRLPAPRPRAELGDMPIDAACALVEARTLAPISADAAALGRAAALQAFAITAVSPSPGLDALVFLWRGIRLVRQVAALHGYRPGIAGTLSLLRRVALDAAMVAATDVAVDAALRGPAQLPLRRAHRGRDSDRHGGRAAHDSCSPASPTTPAASCPRPPRHFR